MSFLLPPRKDSRAPRPWRKETGRTVETSSTTAPAFAGLIGGFGVLFGVMASVGEDRGQVGDEFIGLVSRAGGCAGVKNAISGAKISS